MTVDEGFESLVVGNDYPLVRDFLAYGLGMVSCSEARNRLGPNTMPTCIDDIAQDDVETMACFICETFGLEAAELPQLDQHSLRHYILDLVRALEDHGVLPHEACAKMQRALPEDWSRGAA